MMFLAKVIGISVLMILMHELGHFVAFRAFGKHPKVEIKGFNIFIGDDVIWQMKGYQAAIVALSGIVFGAVPFFVMLSKIPFPMSYLMFLMYGVGAYFDFIVLFNGIKKPFDLLAE